MEQNKFCDGKGKLAIFFILGVVILAGIAGIFYYKYKSGAEVAEQLRAPKLFEKGDYKVEDRPDGQYIVVDKVGLTAKVPTDWRVEFEGNDMPDGTSEYWVNLLSQDAEKKSGLLAKGCGFSILIGANKEAQDIQNAIGNINDGMSKIKEIKPDFIFSTTTVGTKGALESISPIRKIFGKTISINIPIKETLVVLETRIPEGYEDTCSTIWDNFLKTIDLK